MLSSSLVKRLLMPVRLSYLVISKPLIFRFLLTLSFTALISSYNCEKPCIDKISAPQGTKTLLEATRALVVNMPSPGGLSIIIRSYFFFIGSHASFNSK